MDHPSVLIVDDEIIIARELESRLLDMGYRVPGIASTGAEAVQLASDARPDLVLMDIVLKGGMDGIEAAAEIRRRLRIPVIYVTAYTDSETLARAKVTEPFAYIVKPFSERELSANIEIALYKHKMETKLRRIEQWFYSAMLGSADALIETDAGGRIVGMNRAAEAVTGWSRGEAAGRPIGSVLRLANRDRKTGTPAGIPLDGPVVGLSEDTVLYDKSNNGIPVDSAFACVRDAEDRPVGAVAFIRDGGGRRAGPLAAMNADLKSALSRTLTLDGMLQLCAESIARNLDAALVRVWAPDAEGGLALRASSGPAPGPPADPRAIAPGRNPIGGIAMSRQPLVTNDAAGDPRIPREEWAEGERITAFAGFPLPAGDRAAGVLAVYSRRALNPPALEALESAAGQMALGIGRKLADESLRAARARLEYVLSLSPAIIYSLKLGGAGAESVWVSPNIATLLGHDPPKTWSPGWWLDNVHPEDREERKNDLAMLAVKGELVTEYRFRDGGGEYRWIRDEKRLVRGMNGGMAECVGSLTDIGGRKRAERALFESEERLRQITDNANVALWLLELGDMRFLYVSPAFESMWRGSRHRLFESPRSWMKAVHPEDLPRLFEDCKRAVRGEALVMEFRLAFPDGEVRHVENHCFPISGANGETARLAGFAEDVTGRRRLEDQFLQSQKMEAVGHLAGGIAHDFNNLLMVINGCGEMLLLEGGLDEYGRELVSDIVKAGERAGSLTRQLLAFSRKQILEPIILDLNLLVKNFRTMLTRILGEDIVLSVVLAPDLGLVRADPGQVEQVIVNLAVNARDAMPDGGRLTIETGNAELDEAYAQTHPGANPGLYAMLAVSDTGTGMPPEVRSRVFEPFYTTKEPGRGTGLGLSTVYGIVKQSGGHADVCSEPGAGAVFRIYLPLVEMSGRDAEGVSAPRGMPAGSETVLLAEDEDAVRSIARHTLTTCGYKVLEARNGSEALRVGRGHAGPIDLVLTDVVMPGLSGRRFVEVLTAIRPGIKVLFMSGYTDDAVVRRGVLREQTAFLQKPFSPFALAEKVRELLDS